jgi:hypothetical protein
MVILSDCFFKRKNLSSMGEKYSKFRGKGSISIDNEKIIIVGKRIFHPPALRGFMMLFLSAMPSIISKNYLIFLPLLLISYYVFQYVILKSEYLSLKWEQIKDFEIDSRKITIAFSIENNPSCSPVVFKSPKFEEIASVFIEKLANRNCR